MIDFWRLWSGELDSPLISNIITECEYYAPQESTLGHSGETVIDGYRSSELRWINKHDPNSKFIADLMWLYAERANRDAFGFDISYLNDIQYTTYRGTSSDHYDWHHDTFWANPTCFDRKLTVIFQLSDPSDYEGGVFSLDKQYPQPEKQLLQTKGSVLVFPSFIPHMVTPVTSGIRKVVVGWIEGPKFR